MSYPLRQIDSTKRTSRQAQSEPTLPGKCRRQSAPGTLTQRARLVLALSLAALLGVGLLPPRTKATAGAGDLDLSFDGDGKATTDFFGGSDDIFGVAVQPDGKIVVAGDASPTNFSSDADFALARYNPDGSLDASFDGDGRVTTHFPGSVYSTANAIVLQSDGKIVAVGGTCCTVGQDFALARYNPDGSLDTNFDGDGIVTTDFSVSGDFAFGAAIQPDGKILAAGYSDSGSRLFAVARYNPDGSLDTSFDGDGKAVTDFTGSNFLFCFAVALQPDGKIVTAGSTFGATLDFALARFNSDGSLDVGFGTGGRVTTDLAGAGGNDDARAVAIRPDGKIVVAGASTYGNGFALARYNLDGSLDTSFDGDGVVTTAFDGPSATAYTMALGSDGKMVVGGAVYGSDGGDFALACYNPDGSLDTTFDSDGKATVDFAGRYDEAEAVAIQSDGKIVLAGLATNGAGNLDFALVRFNGASVLTPTGQIASLTTTVQSFNLAQGISNSLDAKLQNALDALNAARAGDVTSVCNQMNAFINNVQAQSGKAITTAQANQLIASANQIKTSLGCQ